MSTKVRKCFALPCQAVVTSIFVAPEIASGILGRNYPAPCRPAGDRQRHPAGEVRL